MNIEIGDVFSGTYYKRKTSRKIDLISHGVIYYTDLQLDEGFRVLEKDKLEVFERWFNKNCTEHKRDGKVINSK